MVGYGSVRVGWCGLRWCEVALHNKRLIMTLQGDRKEKAGCNMESGVLRIRENTNTEATLNHNQD